MYRRLTSQRRYVVSRMQKYEGAYLITERFYSNGVEIIGKYCVLNEEYEITSGTLFPGVDSLTETEFAFINGEFSENPPETVSCGEIRI